MPSEILTAHASVRGTNVELLFDHMLGDEMVDDTFDDRVISSGLSYRLEQLKNHGIIDLKVEPENRVTFTFFEGLKAHRVITRVMLTLAQAHDMQPFVFCTIAEATS